MGGTVEPFDHDFDFDFDAAFQAAGAPPPGAPSSGTDDEVAARPRWTWRGRMVLIGGIVLVVLLVAGSALAHTLMHVTGTGCGGG